METKRCLTCGETQPLDDFVKNKKAKDGRMMRCKKCWRAATRKWRQQNPKGQRYLKRNHRVCHLRQYGMTPADYDAMFAAQLGVCALCHQPGKYKGLHVDHDHETGRTRALLCSTCNTALGLFKENPELMEQAAEYIRRFR